MKVGVSKCGRKGQESSRDLTLPEGYPSKGLDLQFLLQDFMNHTLLWSLFDLLSPNYIHTLGGQDQVPFDGLWRGKARGYH